jgi:hypothetical protein
MSNTPTIPPTSFPMPPFWRNEEDWLVVIEFLRRDDEEDRARGTEAIGYMFAFAQMTDTRMLALVAIRRRTPMNCSSHSPPPRTKPSSCACSNQTTRHAARKT